MLYQLGQGNLQEMPVKITKTVVDAIRSTDDSISKFYIHTFFNQFVHKFDCLDAPMVNKEASKFLAKPSKLSNKSKNEIGSSVSI